MKAFLANFSKRMVSKVLVKLIMFKAYFKAPIGNISTMIIMQAPSGKDI